MTLCGAHHPDPLQLLQQISSVHDGPSPPWHASQSYVAQSGPRQPPAQLQGLTAGAQGSPSSRQGSALAHQPPGRCNGNVKSRPLDYLFVYSLGLYSYPSRFALSVTVNRCVGRLAPLFVLNSVVHGSRGCLVGLGNQPGVRPDALHLPTSSITLKRPVGS